MSWYGRERCCQSVQCHIIMPQHMNGENRLFGGQLMMWIDEIAGIAARRYCKCNVTTACVDKLDFLGPAHFNDTLILIAYVSYVGNTSLEITVETYVEKLDGNRSMVNKAHLVEVALDENEIPIRVPAYEPKDEEERMIFEAGKARDQLRKMRRESGI